MVAPYDMSNGELRRALVNIYSRVSCLSGLYVRARLALAPMLEAARQIPAAGDILDLGCGYGIFAHVIRLHYPDRNILGIDRDEGRIRIARKTAKDYNLRFMVGDVGEFDWHSHSVVTIVDLLHHMPFEAQEHLLNRVSSTLGHPGFVLIKDLHKDPKWKYLFHYMQDTLSSRSRLYFRSSPDMIRVLHGNGFDVQMLDLGKGRPHPHVLYLCTK